MQMKRNRIIFLTCFLITYILSGFVYTGYTTPSEWAQESITILSLNSLLTESLMENEKYQDPITREEFTELALGIYIKAKGTSLEEIDDTHPFLDTSNPNIGRAYNLGIIRGISNRRFAPKKEITRQEIATILWRQINMMGITTEPHKTADFSDMFRVSKWAKEAISFCWQEGLMTGIGNNRIAPSENTTREQAMVLLANAGKKYGWLNPYKTTKDFETLENGYLIPNKTDLLIRMNEATKLHLQLITDPYGPKEHLPSDMEEILATLRINKISENVVLKLKQKIQDSWHEAYNAPVLENSYIIDLDDGRRVELRCDKGIDISIYTPLFHDNASRAINAAKFEQLSNGYYVPKESTLFVQSDDERGIRLNILTHSSATGVDIHNQIHQMLDILKMNEIPQETIMEIERKVSSSWNHIENKPGKIEITYRELPSGDRLVYSSDSYMQIKIFHMDL
ncbi:hypothetical protein HNQ80_002695 [Anaerosolibacter carboniphilus]|uniref:SLH domain-containing protein n=1 Tax=Anaerosolibacter carboniphilus TaxID=1417629 RepID=A0A841KT57_9FIRM|nr:hypothetical protein [Anaerosolibacter carboniphilus]